MTFSSRRVPRDVSRYEKDQASSSTGDLNYEGLDIFYMNLHYYVSCHSLTVTVMFNHAYIQLLFEHCSRNINFDWWING